VRRFEPSHLRRYHPLDVHQRGVERDRPLGETVAASFGQFSLRARGANQ